MSTHQAVEEEVLLMDCIYGECEHDEAPDCPTPTMLVCDTCRDVWEDDTDYEMFVKWPCAEAET